MKFITYDLDWQRSVVEMYISIQLDCAFNYQWINQSTSQSKVSIHRSKYGI